MATDNLPAVTAPGTLTCAPSRTIRATVQMSHKLYCVGICEQERRTRPVVVPIVIAERTHDRAIRYWIGRDGSIIGGGDDGIDVRNLR